MQIITQIEFNIYIILLIIIINDNRTKRFKIFLTIDYITILNNII